MLPGREVAAAYVSIEYLSGQVSGCRFPNPKPPLTMPPGAAGPAREFQVTVVCLPISIEAVSDFTAAGDRQRRTG
jgi:hypothetical protein